jgi:hypothetical protein
VRKLDVDIVFIWAKPVVEEHFHGRGQSRAAADTTCSKKDTLTKMIMTAMMGGGGGGGGDAVDEGNTPSPNIRFCIPPRAWLSCSMASLRILHVITGISSSSRSINNIIIISSSRSINIIIISSSSSSRNINIIIIIIISSSIYLNRTISDATCSVLAAILRSSLPQQARYKRG